MVFLPKDSSKEMVETYTMAFQKVLSRPDFAEISKKRLGVYPQATGEKANTFLRQGTVVDPKAISWIKGWLKDRYGVELKS